MAELLAEGSPVLDLARLFRNAGHELYLVGGPVRDMALRREHTDLDFATDAVPEETQAVLRPVASEMWTQGIEFGTIGAFVAGVHMEITTFRTERYEPDSRHPAVEFGSDIEVDLSRRDFTVNAMAIRLPERTPIDPFGGMEDLKKRVLRTPIEPEQSFADDPLRMLRAFRFASQLKFRIADEVLAAIKEMKGSLRTISAERIRDELSKLVTGPAVARALMLADDTGITDIFLPELGALKLEQDPVQRHKDVFAHTLAVVERTDPELNLRLAALLHDIGKPSTREISEDGVTFYHHEVVGARMARDRLKEMRFPNHVVDEVSQLIFLHHRFHGYDDGWTDAAVRRYVRDAGPLLGTLNLLVRADCTTRNPAKARRLQEAMDAFEARIRELAEREELERIRPDLDGTQVMAYLGAGEGRMIGEALENLLDLRMEEGPLGTDEAYARL
ncbi:MAG: CCA tRNA nucleotidyltransferase, partial [Actinobacteria bacterium]|nr:CCA tRNA nucleotidyltransferase [Actinomycetota bacterium]